MFSNVALKMLQVYARTQKQLNLIIDTGQSSQNIAAKEILPFRLKLATNARVLYGGIP